MKTLKRYLQNQKGLKKLDTKHVPHNPKENFEFFQKRGVKGSKNGNCEKIPPKQKRTSKIGY